MFTDFHSHILPNIDDGSHSVEESLQMLQKEAEQGIDCVVATPHFYPRHHEPVSFLKARKESYSRLMEKCAEIPGIPRIVLGAEVHYFSGISDSQALSGLTIGQSRYILIEMPYVKWSESMFQELEHIYVNQGITPVIAHVDRYFGLMQRSQLMYKLEQLPVMIQANAEFFTNRSTSAYALRLLRDDRIHILGSDCHNMSDRAPNLGDAVGVIRKSKLDGCLDRLCQYAGYIL